MSQVTVRWRDTERTFGPDKPVRVGRAVHCEVLVLDERVSRDPHLELRFQGGVWVLEDRSSGGTWFNGRRVDLVSVPEAHTFNLGAPDGPPLTVTPHPVEPPPGTPSGSAPSGVGAGSSPPSVDVDPDYLDAVADAATPTPPAAATPTPATAAGASAEDPGAALLREAARLREEGENASTPADTPSGPPPSGPPPSAPPPRLPPLGPPPQGPPPSQAADPPRFDPSATVSVDDQALRLNTNDRHLLVPPGNTVVVGRDPDCDLVIDSQIVSRQHARFTHDGTGWMLEDLASTRGTFVDGRRLKRPYRAAGVFEINLGDDNAGEKVRVVTAGEHQVPRSRLPVVLASCALVVALLAAAAVWWASNDGDDTAASVNDTTTAVDNRGPATAADSSVANTDEQLAKVKAASVLIEAVDGNGRPMWTGSGTVITDQGHILTNAHVADPGAKSLDALESLLGGLEDRSPAAEFVVWVSPDEDEAATPRYRAEWVSSSRTQDAAVIRITEDITTGEPVTSVPIEPIPIGSSETLRAGQRIHALGYPGQATTLSISVIEGQVISLVSADEFRDVLGGDTRTVMNTNAVLGQGSSGGPVVRNGEIVGVNFTVSSIEGLDRGWVVPISEIGALLAEFGL